MLESKSHCRFGFFSSNGFVTNMKCQSKDVSESYAHRFYPLKSSVYFVKQPNKTKHKNLGYFIPVEQLTVGNCFD